MPKELADGQRRRSIHHRAKGAKSIQLGSSLAQPEPRLEANDVCKNRAFEFIKVFVQHARLGRGLF
jgi:hypothetical protein